jgi:hypothetical protein
MLDSPDTADTIVLYEELAFQDVLPVRWHGQPPQPAAAASLAERNLQVLQAWDALEDHGVIDKPDDNAPLAADIQRLDRKLTLLLGLVGQLLTLNRPRPPAAPLRFNARGAIWRASGTLPDAGAHGLLEIHLHECVAQPLRLPGEVTAVSPAGEVKVRFEPLDDALAAVIAKIAFRRHRRQIAGRHGPNRKS